MEKWNRLILLFLSVLFVNLVIAQTVSVNVAQNVAKNFLYERLNSNELKVKYVKLNLSCCYTERQGSNNLYYIFNADSNRGWVIVSSQKSVIPVLAYSFKGIFDTTKANQPPAFKEWMNNYRTQILSATTVDQLLDTAISLQWDRYENFNQNKSIVKANTIAELLSTTWDQGCLYNASCPLDVGGQCGRVWAGCVATAMAQIMKYWAFPVTGNSSHGYTDPNYGYQSANFGATTYNWSSMPDHLTTANAAIATLIYHCGVAVDMGYGVSGSSASNQVAGNSLVSYFEYSSDLSFEVMSDYSSSAWQNLMVSNINNYMPVLYRGDGTGGHSFVLDGYDSPGHFHFNWGWSGSYNGYFYLTSLTPGTGHDYTNNQMAVVNIHPPNCVPTYNFTSSMSGSADYEASNYITASNTINSGANITYDAKNYVLLTDGFQAANGSTFHAVPDGCGGYDKSVVSNVTNIGVNKLLISSKSDNTIEISESHASSNISVNWGNKSYSYKIIDTNGDIVQQKSVQAGEKNSIDMSSFKLGNYTIVFDDNFKNETVRFEIKK